MTGDFPARRLPGVISNSWGGPEYSDWMDEQMSWKTTCYVGDWSWLHEFTVSGKDAVRFFSEWAVNSFAKFDIDQAKHATFCNADGKVIGEGVLIRRSEDVIEFNSAGPVVMWLQYQLERGSYDATFTLKVNEFKYQVSGPNALPLLEEFAGQSLREVGFMRIGNVVVGGVKIAFLRQGMAGEIGIELHGPNEAAPAVYAKLLELGQKYGLRRLGARTAMINHLEAGFPTIVHDSLPAITGEAESEFFRQFSGKSIDIRTNFDVLMKVRGSFDSEDVSAWYRSPYELGWGKSVKFDHDFYGRAALEAESVNQKRRIVSLVWNKDDVIDVYASLFRDETPFDFMDMPRANWVASYASAVTIEGREVGVATARGYSLFFRKMLSHCVIDIEHAEPGTEVVVNWGTPGGPTKPIRATVDRYPYKTDRRRADLTAL